MRPASLLAQPPIWRETRLGIELAALMRDPVFRGEGVARGGGQPVLLVPGLLAGDDSLGFMTRWLRKTGHHTRSAGIRSNIDCSAVTAERLVERLECLAERQGQRVAIIGQSRGGHFAKVLAVRRPDLVSGIVTLGSPQLDPFDVHPLVHVPIVALGALGAIGARGVFTRGCVNGRCCERFWEDMRRPLPDGPGYVSIYSRSDGIVNWRACLDPDAEQIEVKASHCGMAVHAGTYRELARALRRFRRRDARRGGAAWARAA